MAAGDIAGAAGYTVKPSSEQADTLASIIALVQDDLASKTGSKGAAIPVSKGGTGATSAAAARSALGLVIATTLTGSDGKVPTYSGNGTLAVDTPTASNHAAPKSYVDANAGAGKVSKSGDTMTGNLVISGANLYVPSSSLASSSYTVAYINGDGRLARGASSERYKKFIKDIDPLSLGDLFPPFKRFQLRGGDGVWRYGYTAEQIAADPATEQFAVYQRHIEDDGTAPHLERDKDGAPIPESIDFIGLLLAQNAQLNARLARLEGDQT